MAGLDVVGEVAAGRDLGAVAAGSQVRVYGGGPQPAPTVGSLTDSVTAGRTLYSAYASGDVGGTLRAGGAIGQVLAQGSVVATVSAAGGIGSGALPPEYAPYSTYSVYFGPPTPYVGIPLGGGSAVQAGQDFTGSVSGGGSVYGISAGWDLAGSVHAGGDLTSLTAGHNLSTTADAAGRITTVSATNDITGTITAGADIGLVQAGTWSAPYFSYHPPLPPDQVPAPGNISGRLAAAGGVLDVLATGDISGSITAGAALGSVFAAGSISGSLSAAGTVCDATWWGTPALTIPSGYYGPDGNWQYLFLWPTAVQAGQDFSGSVSGGGDILGVAAGRDFTGSATSAGGDISSVTAGRDLFGTLRAKDNLPWLSAGRDLGTTADAGLDIITAIAGEPAPSFIGPVTQTGSVWGILRAGRDIHTVEATGDVMGTIDANRGRFIGANHGVGRIAAGGNVGATIFTLASVGTLADTTAYSLRDGPSGWASLSPSPWPTVAASLGIHAGLDFTGYISAEDVVSVAAGRDITGIIWAARDIGWVRAGRSVTATATIYSYRGDVLSVWAGALDDGYESTPVPEPGNMAGRVRAYRDVHQIYATQDVTDPITAVHGIGSVTADRDVTSTITATASVGSLADRGQPEPEPTGWNWYDWYDYYGLGFRQPADPTAGVHAGRDDLGTVSAGDDVVAVTAGQDVKGTVHAGQDVKSVSSGRDVGAAIDAGRDAAPLNVVRDLTGSVKSGRNLGAITVGRDVAGDEIRAGEGPVDLTARGNITLRSLVSDKEAVTADAGGSVQMKNPSAADDLNNPAEAKAAKNLWVSGRGGSVGGKLTATGGWAYVWSYTDVNGSVTADQTASVTAWNDLNASVTSDEDGAEAFAGHDVNGDITASAWVDVEAQHNIKGTIQGQRI